MYSLDSLNEIQKKVAMDTDGAIMVTAGAGSGKTRLLTHRICYLIEEMGVSPYNILAITFTNKAAKEMKERLVTMINNLEGITIRTFHSLCALILRENIDKLDGFTSNYSIYDENDQKKVVKNVCKSLEIDLDDLHIDILKEISNAKNSGISPSNYRFLHENKIHVNEIVKIYSAYQEELKNCNALDFDDLIMKVFELFSNNQEILCYYTDKFRYILVDEFQDTNEIQYKLIKLLSLKYGNVFVVGDEDQCIYSWRGADITNIQNFLKDYNATLYKLEQNYRSTKNILNMANRLIEFNNERIKKSLFTNNAAGHSVGYRVFGTESKEADFVARCVKKLIDDGVSYDDICILMRLSSASKNIEEKLLSYGIPCIVSGSSFMERKEIKVIMSYLALLLNPKDNNRLIDVINFPKRGIGDATVDKIQELAVSHNTHMLDIIENFRTIDDMPANIKSKIMEFSDLMVDLKANYENMGLTEIVKYVIEKIEIKGLYNTKSEDDIDRTRNIEQFYDMVLSFEKDWEDETRPTLLDFLENKLLNKGREQDLANGSVKVYTIHASKGLEFKYVFIINLVEGKFPLYCDDSEMEEERRLMYVAITRAKECLTITRSETVRCFDKNGFIDKDCKPSRFLQEIGFENHHITTIDDDFNNKIDSLKLMSNVNQIINKPIKIDNNIKSSKYKIGAKVSHSKLGIGTIVDVVIDKGEFVVVDFGGDVGKKKLSVMAPMILIKGN